MRTTTMTTKNVLFSKELSDSYILYSFPHCCYCVIILLDFRLTDIHRLTYQDSDKYPSIEAGDSVNRTKMYYASNDSNHERHCFHSGPLRVEDPQTC